MVTDIGKVSGIDQIVSTGKTKPTHKTEQPGIQDKVNVSAEAKRLADIEHTIEIVKNTPDVRLDKIAEAKKLIESGQYSNKDVLDKVADKILNNLGM